MQLVVRINVLHYDKCQSDELPSKCSLGVTVLAGSTVVSLRGYSSEAIANKPNWVLITLYSTTLLQAQALAKTNIQGSCFKTHYDGIPEKES